MPFGCTPSLFGTPPFTLRLTSAEIGTPKSGFGSPIFSFFFQFFPTKTENAGSEEKILTFLHNISLLEFKRRYFRWGEGYFRTPVSGSEREISRSEAQSWDVKPQFSDFLAAASPSELQCRLCKGQDSSSEGAVSGSEAGNWE